MRVYSLDGRRDIAIPGDQKTTLQFAVDHWIQSANHAIKDHDFFSVALSGGSTPKKIFQELSSEKNAKKVDWSKVYFFWSDERSVPPDDPDSNFRMALIPGGLSRLPIPTENMFRMNAEENIEENAQLYEKLIQKKLGSRSFDLIMLGMGDDGHTASLFPHTKGLSEKKRLVIPNHVPQHKTWRMTFTFDLINSAKAICIYVLGSQKAEILNKVLLGGDHPDEFPSQNIGTSEHKALWIIDEEAGQNILSHLK